MSFTKTGRFITLLFLTFIVSGCFFNDPAPFFLPEDIAKAEETDVPFKGYIGIEGMNGSTGRSAIAAIPNTIEYFVKAETPDDTPGGKLTVNVPASDINTTAGTFSINLKTGYYWTITVGIKDTSSTYYPDDDRCIILSDSYGKTVSATDTSIVHNFTLKPTTGSTGSVDLYISVPSGITLSITDENNSFDWNSNLIQINTATYRIDVTSITSGIYVLKLKFQQTGKKPYIATQTIAVYDNMKTNTWVSGGNALITGSTFELTSTIYNASVNGQRNFYVDATDGDDTNGTGESLTPLKTVEKAIGIIDAIGDDTSTYKVYAKAGGSESTSTDFTLTKNIDVVVYEDGEGKGPAHPSGSYTINFTSNGTLFYVNKHFSITGLNLIGPDNTNDSIGVQLQISGTQFTLNSGEITKFTVGVVCGSSNGAANPPIINLYGGNIHHNGLHTTITTGAGVELNYGWGQPCPVLNVKGNPVVKDNKSMGVVKNISFISTLQGEKITFVGPLTVGCDLGISIPDLLGVGNTNARQITENYNTYNSTTSPTSYIHGDKYAVGKIPSSNEVFLGQSGGSYQLYNFDEISIVRADTSNKTTKLQDGTLDLNFKIMKGSSPLTPTPELEVFDITGYGSSFKNAVFYSKDGLKVTLKENALPGGNYNVIVGFTYEGARYDYSQNVVVTAPAEVNSKTFSGTAITNSNVFITNRNLTFKPLIACEHEVTQKEYEQYMTYYGTAKGQTGSSAKKPTEQYGLGPDYPAYYLNWYEAVMYCNLRSEAENLTPAYYLGTDANGNKITSVASWKNVSGTNIASTGSGSSLRYYYNSLDTDSTTLAYTGDGDSDGGIQFDETANGWRLPTEAEWEYLARGRNLTTSNPTYSGSDAVGDVAWYTDNSAVNGTKKSHEVCTKAPNVLGLYDMSGNVWEWCWDWYTDNSNISATTPAAGPAPGSYHRVYRGGSWSNDATYCTVSYRGSYRPYYRLNFLGFRVVRSSSE